MKPESTRGARRLLPRRKRGTRRDAGPEPVGDGQCRAAALDPDFDPVEFAEFLEADDSPLPIDPAFRERLREQLWGLVRDRAAEERGQAPPRRPR